jgi:hypothetical protein
MLNEPYGLVRPEGLGKLKKIRSPDRVSNPRHCCLFHSASAIPVVEINQQMFVSDAILQRFLQFSG